MSTPYQYIETTGIITSDTSDVLDEVGTEWQNALGSDLALTSDTPQGKIIAMQTSGRINTVNNNVALANQINPNFAGGVFLDAICALLGLTRQQATFGVKESVPITGIPLQTLQAGLQAKSTSTQTVWASTRQIQLDATGNATVDFQCTTSGPVASPAGDLTIAVQVLGWETINDTVVGTLGQVQQSDDSLRALRNQTLALQGISTPEAQSSGLAAVPGVLSFSYRENVDSTTEIIDGISLTGHSVWACVDGGADIDVATSLLENKTDGAGWNGAVAVPVVEPASGQTYNVLFDRTVALAAICRCTVYQANATADLSTAVPAAVIAYASGQIPGQAGLITGVNASPFEIAYAIGQQIAGIRVAKVELALASTGAAGYSTDELVAALNQKYTISLSAVTTIINTTT